MKVFLELDKRIAEARKLLALEELHLERVRRADLDDGTALDLVTKQRRHLNCLISQRERIIAHRGVPHRGLGRPATPQPSQLSH